MPDPASPTARPFSIGVALPPSPRTLFALLTFAAATAGASGCASIDRSILLGKDDHVFEMGDPEKKPSAWDKILKAGGIKKDPVNPYMRPTVSPEAQAALADAQKKFDAGDYKASEKQAKALAKKYKDTVAEEEALFLLAESRYAQREYSWAQDSYAELFERFPSTRYMDESTARMFEISKYWLRFPELVHAGDVQPVNFETPNQSPLPKPKEQPFDITRTIPVVPNVRDRSRPVFDTEGRALEALKSIWLNDPTGPLADDALMLTATYYLRRGNFLEADHYYQILRDEYPKSPHLEDAFVLGSHVKLMSYQGASYDGQTLEQARELKASTLRLFPQTAERDRLVDELKLTQQAEAARQWDSVRFYQRKGKPRSIAVACHALITDYPDSKYAGPARKIYSELPADSKVHLPPLPAEPSRTVMPDLQPVPATAEGGSPSGRASL